MAQKDKQQSKNLLTKAGLEAFQPPWRLIQELSIWATDKPSVKIRKLRPEEVISEFGGGSTVRRTQCDPTEAIDIAGQSRTGDNGKMTW